VSPLNEGVPLTFAGPLKLNSDGEVTSKGVAVEWHGDYEKVVPKVLVQKGVRVTAPNPGMIDGQTFTVTAVLAGRVPVTLDDGLATGHYYFVGPGFVSFEPALPFMLPNTDKLELHARVLIMRYDSGKGRWVKEGTAHVSDDALEIENDDGDGIRGGGWYAFPAEFTRPELTFVDYLQIQGNPRFEGAAITHTDTYYEGKRAVMATGWGDAEFKRLHFRVTYPTRGEIIEGTKGMEAGDTEKDLYVTITPHSWVLKLGERLILLGRGRPYPGGYYVWSSDDTSIASVVPFLSDGGIEHPNRANVIAHKRGRVKIRLMYVTLAGATAVATAEIICR